MPSAPTNHTRQGCVLSIQLEAETPYHGWEIDLSEIGSLLFANVSPYPIKPSKKFYIVLDKYHCGFLWTENEEYSRGAFKVTWNKVCQLIGRGGGSRNLRSTKIQLSFSAMVAMV